MLDGHEDNAIGFETLLKLFPLGALAFEGTQQILCPDNELFTHLLNSKLHAA